MNVFETTLSPKLRAVRHAVARALHEQEMSADRVLSFSAETATKTGMIMVLGEITTKSRLDYQKIVRETVKEIGFDDSSKGQVLSNLIIRLGQY